jgi:hypothetical protein
VAEDATSTANVILEEIGGAAEEIGGEAVSATREAAEWTEAETGLPIGEAGRHIHAAGETVGQLAEEIAEEAIETTLEIASHVGVSVVGIADDVLEAVGEWVEHKENKVARFLNKRCMLLRPLFYIDETLGAAIDEQLGSYTSRSEAANIVLEDFADMDATKLFELLVGAMLDSAADHISKKMEKYKVGTVSLKTATKQTLRNSGLGRATLLLDALKIAFHFSCMKYDDDDYGVWAREQYDDRCINSEDPCNSGVITFWKYCLFQFPVRFAEDLAAISETCSD